MIIEVIGIDPDNRTILDINLNEYHIDEFLPIPDINKKYQISVENKVIKRFVEMN